MNSANIQSHAIEILTTEEVLKRLKIGRTKLFELIKKGTLKPGHHFVRNGRMLRFIWGIDLIRALHESPIEELVSANRPPSNSKHARAATGRSAIDMNY